VIEAFKMAVAPGAPARLILKCVNADSDPDGFAALQAQAQGYAIDIHEGYWPATAVADLMAACDAYVSLHRAEGAGLTISDAMAQGKPVIATGWSGNMDFMTAANSFPVRYQLVPLAQNVGPYPAGAYWAEPDVAHAARLMRFVYTHGEEARAKGARARQDIEASFSPQSVAETIQQRLSAIAVRRRLPAFRQVLHAHYRQYRQLADLIRGSVRGILPPDATVAVVSKGDDELLALDGRPAWHFPQDPRGNYAGYYPVDSAEAIAQLEAIRARGASYLLFPHTAFWWLDHYTAFRQHLERHYPLVVHKEDVCMLFCLRPAAIPALGQEYDTAWTAGIQV
jgi:hypothetical protein